MIFFFISMFNCYGVVVIVFMFAGIFLFLMVAVIVLL